MWNPCAVWKWPPQTSGSLDFKWRYYDVSNQQDATVEMELTDVVPAGSSVGSLYQKLYIQSKMLLRMGEFVAWNT